MWIDSSTDSDGVTTFYPPEPTGCEEQMQCSICGTRMQIAHFFSQVLSVLEGDEVIPLFCSGVCAGMFIKMWTD